MRNWVSWISKPEIVELKLGKRAYPDVFAFVDQRLVQYLLKIDTREVLHHRNFFTLVGRDVCHSNFKPAMRNQRSQAARNKRREQLENLKKAKEGGLSRTDLLEVRSCFFFVSLRSCSWMTGKMSSSCWMKMSTSN
jgi:hypothetical protein